MKTAVDYLEERMECGGITWEDIQQAKEMEKKQIIEALHYFEIEYAEKYYNETFKP